MQTPEIDAKAEAVRHHLVGKNIVVLEHRYFDRGAMADDPREYVRLKPREWFYRYMLQDKAGAAEVRVTFEAMRDADVRKLGGLVLEARRRKGRGDAGTAWIELVDGKPDLTLDG
jgi:hypothetical protein